MEPSKRYIRLGLFVMASLCVLVAMLFVFGWRIWFQSTFTFETYFDKSIAGLALGAPASFRGVPLGHITEIRTSVATYERSVPVNQRRNYIVVRVKASMPAAEAEQMKQDIAVLIRRGLRAQTQLAGVTGQQYMELDFLNPMQHPPLPFAWTPEYIYLPSAPSVAGEIIAKAQALLISLDDADIRSLGQNLAMLVRDLDAKLREIPVAALSAQSQSVLRNAESLLHRANGVATRLDAVLSDPSLSKTLDNAATISSRLRQLVDDGELDRLVRSLDEAVGRLDGVIGDNQYDVRVLVQDLRVTAENLRALSETIKRDPAGALLGGPPQKIQIPARTP